jgi:transposase-like protein/IS1 family transposase
MNCRCCSGNATKFGTFTNKNRIVQRYRCSKCGTSFSESQPMQGVTVATDKVVQVVHLLVEGVGIRSAARLTGLDQKTILKIIASAGEQCARLLDERIKNVRVESVQVDELFCFVGCKQKNNRGNDYNRGDQYTFLAVDSASKLILSHVIGKRDSGNAYHILNDLNERVAGRFQLTTDAFHPYRKCAEAALDGRVDFAQLMKIYKNSAELKGERRYSPPECVGIRIEVRDGDPDPAMISTSYVERVNLTVRHFNRRFTRLTIGYSKKIEYLRASTALFIAHYNFCRKHSTVNVTPAQAAGLANRAWTIEELLSLSQTACHEK